MSGQPKPGRGDEAEQLRELIREAHAAAKDVRDAAREGRAAAEGIRRDLVADLQAYLKREVDTGIATLQRKFLERDAHIASQAKAALDHVTQMEQGVSERLGRIDEVLNAARGTARRVLMLDDEATL